MDDPAVDDRPDRPRPLLSTAPELHQWTSVLVVLIATTIVTSVAPSRIGQALIGLTLAALVVSVVQRRELVPLWLRVANVVALAPAVALSFTDAASDSSTITGAREVATAVVLVTAMVAILLRVARHPVVTGATVMAVVDVYVLIGLAFAATYGSVEAFTGDMFASGPASPFDTTYFSVITLTTVGFGDLVPGSDLARSIAMVQALLGQVFLVVVVARVVALMGQPNARRPQP